MRVHSHILLKILSNCRQTRLLPIVFKTNVADIWFMKTAITGVIATAIVIAIAASALDRKTQCVEVSGLISGLAGNDHVVVSMTGDQTHRATTRVRGLFSIADIEPGLYTITPIHSRYTFHPAKMVVNISDDSIKDIRFKATKTTKKGKRNHKK